MLIDTNITVVGKERGKRRVGTVVLVIIVTAARSRFASQKMTEKGGKNINSESFVVLALLIIASIPLIVFHTMFYKNEPWSSFL